MSNISSLFLFSIPTLANIYFSIFLHILILLIFVVCGMGVK